MGWVKNPPASRQEYDLVAYTATDTARLVYPVRTLDALTPHPHPLVTVETVSPAKPATLYSDSLARFVSDTDRIIIGRPSPRGTYEWFLFPGTHVEIDRYFADMARVALDANRHIWVSREDLKARSGASHLRPLEVNRASVTPAHDWIDVKLSVALPPAYIVQESDQKLTLILYNSTTDQSTLHVPSDRYLRAATVEHSAHRVVYTFSLSQPIYGYLALYKHGVMTFRIRRPPVVDPSEPLRGLTIVVDAGHPPAGATGPTGLYEADANLAVAQRVQSLLQTKGAHVIMTRTNADPVALGDRPIMARRVNANALVSIHQNALPDGMNPFRNHGTGTYYFHTHSKRFATLMQGSLVSQLGLRDLGTFHKNLALARPTWMPAVLTEGTFIIMPDEEAALRTPEYQQAYARGVVGGLEKFFATFAQ
jgi:N-acetylmuramoyl-L-alanine amidase